MHFLSLDSSRLVDNNNVKEFEYFTSDLLGNTRQVLRSVAGNLTVSQDNHYGVYTELSRSTFGMQIDGLSAQSTNTNCLTYNNKEKDIDLNWYHYGTRFYDPAVGRWWGIDPIDEYYSPYNYVGNNFINSIDYDGRGEMKVRALTPLKGDGGFRNTPFHHVQFF